MYEGPATAPAAAGATAPDRDDPSVLVTYLAESGVGPVTVDGRVVLETRSPAVWFTFPGARHDIGRFHTPGGAFTGFYANILTPVELLGRAADGAEVWRTTDLFLDVFMAPGEAPGLLDADELDAAVAAGWVDPETAAAAADEAHRLLDAARDGRWPPAIVRAWPLGRARAVAGDVSAGRNTGTLRTSGGYEGETSHGRPEDG